MIYRALTMPHKRCSAVAKSSDITKFDAMIVFTVFANVDDIYFVTFTSKYSGCTKVGTSIFLIDAGSAYFLSSATKTSGRRT